MHKDTALAYSRVDEENAALHLQEILLFVAFGLGPSFGLLDAVYLELAWFEETQPDGLNISAWISLAQAASVFIVIPFLGLEGWLNAKQTIVSMCLSIAVPAMTFILALTWRFHIGRFNISIVGISCLATVLGNFSVTIVIPWIASTFNSKAISAFCAGNALIVFFEVALQSLQRPGSVRLFSPRIYFFIVGTLSIPSIFALFCILKLSRKRIQSTTSGAVAKEFCSLWSQMFPDGWTDGVPYVAYYVLSSMVTWWVCSTILPYAASNTDGGGCENKGEDFLAWTISFGYASGLVGSVFSVLAQEGRFFLKTSIIIQVVACFVVVLAAFGISDWTSWGMRSLLFGAMCVVRFGYAWNTPLIFREVAERHPENAENMTRFVSIWTMIVGLPWLIAMFWMIVGGVFICSV